MIRALLNSLSGVGAVPGVDWWYGLRALLRRVGGNTAWLLLARIGAQGLTVLFTLILARRLGQDGLGAYAFIAAVVYLGNVLTTFGTDTLVMRSVAAHGEFRLVLPALLLQLSLAAAFIALVYLGAPVLPRQSPQAVLALKVYSLALVPMAFYTVFSAALRGAERMAAFMGLNLALAAAQLGLVWVFITPGGSLVSLAWLLLAAQAAVALLAGLLCIACFPGLRQTWRASFAEVIGMSRPSGTLAALGLLKVLYQRASVYLLALMGGAALTGWFSAALRPVEAAQIGHVALLGALFPVMAQAHGSGTSITPDQRRIFRLSWRLLLLSGVSAALALFAFAPFVVTALFGPAFEPAVPALRLLAWDLLPYSVNIYLSTELLAAGREKSLSVVLLLSLAVLIVSSLWFIPRWGLMGACWAVLIAELLQAALYLAMSNDLER